MALIILILASPLKAEDIFYENAQTGTIGFQGLRFGQPPSDDMICIGGPCSFGQQGKIIKKKRSIISTYKKSKDITHYNLIEISAPKYIFWENQFFRVSFQIICKPENAEQCIDTICSKLDRHYGLTLVGEVSEHINPQDELKVRLFLTKSGEIVEVHRYKSRGRWQQPFVRFYNKTLMDRVRLEVNPNYVPMEINCSTKAGKWNQS
ncbi:hypothetical protein [Syntrophotalea carbinolica]|nr:hypothetical protein [Syntrophotalea carbinolica]